jgi:uncharacterized membrane protein YraQ (UPF0718 family)
VITATIAAVATPLCSCGTTAMILGMMASTIPWAPIVAFMVSSPLTSPEGLVYSAGLFGWPFALAFYLASILLGLFGGWAAAWLESRGWLANQNRLAARRLPVRARTSPASLLNSGYPVSRPKPSVPAPCSPRRGGGIPASALHGSESPACELRRCRGCCADYASRKQFLPHLFMGFAFIGYFLNGLILTGLGIFGGGQLYNSGATLGCRSISTEGSLPLVRALLETGMSQGAALAFLIAGSGTSIGAIGGALAIARWRVVGLVVGILWIGAIFAGYAYDLLLALRLF